MYQIKWTVRLVEEFIKRAYLSEEEEYIIKSKARGKSITQIAMNLSVSESSVSRKIRKIREKYDLVQNENPDIFPMRRN